MKLTFKTFADVSHILIDCRVVEWGHVNKDLSESIQSYHVYRQNTEHPPET